MSTTEKERERGEREREREREIARVFEEQKACLVEENICQGN
jgi:polynucleotide 5'-kinase involved in rRNA processing